jgi:hypothetical protein
VELLPVSAALTNQEVTTKQGISAGTFVFGAFSLISLLVSVSRGLVPIYLLEAAGWAGAAWYWQRLKTKSNASKAAVAWLAIAVAIGEVVHIAVSQADSSSARPPMTDSASGRSGTVAPSSPDQFAKYAVTGGNPSPSTATTNLFDLGVRSCPSSIPSGVSSKQLPAEESVKLVGTEGTLDSTSALDDSLNRILLWDAKLNYENRTASCITTAIVELELSHGEKVFRERHGIVFDPLLSPGHTQTLRVKLKVKTPERSEDVALVGWHTISVTGFKL